MSVTDLQARDEINTMLDAAWVAGGATAVGEAVIDLRWKGRKIKDEPQGFWAHVSHNIVTQRQVSMADERTFGANQKRYETAGFTTVQVFAPMDRRNGSEKGFKLASMLRDAFRAAGRSGNVWFENMRINDLPDDGTSHRWNVISEFKYDTIV